MTERLQQIADFLVEIEKFKLIERVACLSDQKRRENDAEHSWHLALMIMTLKDELGIAFDVSHALKIALVHDLVEVYTGDTWVNNAKDKKIKQQKEIEAANKLFCQLPSDLNEEMMSYWLEYEKAESIESKIVKGLDKICYPLQYSISGKIVWHKQEDTTEERRRYGKPHIEFNEVLQQLYNYFIDQLELTRKAHQK